MTLGAQLLTIAALLAAASAARGSGNAPALTSLSPSAPSGATGATGGVPGKDPGAQPGPAGASGATGTTPPSKPQPAPPVTRFGRFDLDQPLSQLAQLPDLKACAPLLAGPTGHAECALGPNDEKLSKLNLAWDDGKAGGELIALRLTFDPQLAPPLTDLEFQLTRGWGPPALEQLRRDHDTKNFTLQWEDPEHRATLEAAGPLAQASRAVAIVLERRPRPLPGDLATLRPKPFPNMRARMVRRLEYDGQPYAVLWGTNLTPSQEMLGETGPAWAAQRSYIGLFKLEAAPPPAKKLDPAPPPVKRKWHAIWERASGDEEDNDLQRIARVDTKDLTGDSDPDLLVELSCPTCGQSTSEVVVKTVRAGKAADLLDKHDLYRASVDARPGQIRIREAEGDNTTTVSTYTYDKSKGAFVLSREERAEDK